MLRVHALFLSSVAVILVEGFWIPDTRMPRPRPDPNLENCLYGFYVEDGMSCQAIESKCNFGLVFFGIQSDVETERALFFRVWARAGKSGLVKHELVKYDF